MDVSRIAEEASRLLPLARRVLTRYHYPVRSVSHLATHSNIMYRVETTAGVQMVLRVGSAHGNTRSNIDFEVAWLAALARDTDLEVVRPLPTRSGDLVVDEFDPTVEKERACVLFSWIPGEPLGAGGPFGYRMLGEVSATLHQHGATWRPVYPEAMRHWDRVFYYGSEIDPVVIANPMYDHIFDNAIRQTLSRAGEVAERVIFESWRSGRPQVVHGDLHEWNVHLAGGRIHVFDFEDLMMALPAQDIAISLYHSRTRPDRDQIQAAFRKGYEMVAEWPVADDEQLDGFMAARQVLLMNYAARTLPPQEAARFVDAVYPWLRGYVAKYG
ncbi:MAG TPA: phosphotransferase [Acidimicrobiia bacterium]|jgi:Ser/Thr protein kinase RdoA (MazF antagonist)